MDAPHHFALDQRAVAELLTGAVDLVTGHGAPPPRRRKGPAGERPRDR